MSGGAPTDDWQLNHCLTSIAFDTKMTLDPDYVQ
jgi:hypothetical protein